MPAVYVKPREGGRVRMPERNFMPMPAEGATVERHSDYYNRLIATGDLVITNPPAPEVFAADDTSTTTEMPATRRQKEK